MRVFLRNTSPTSETELLARTRSVEGCSFLQLANLLGLKIPATPSQRKGWTGMALEQVLGASAGSLPVPDFQHLGIELKTIPLNALGKPAETTFITSIPLLTIHTQVWKQSQCYQKLQRVLWIPVEGDPNIPFEQRRIGSARLWSPSQAEESVLAKDWQELTTMIGTGRLEEITASMGVYLHVRPKAANGRSLCFGFDSEGNKIATLPRGFYLRTCFTESLLL